MCNDVYLLLIPDLCIVKCEDEDTRTVNICVSFINISYIVSGCK